MNGGGQLQVFSSTTDAPLAGRRIGRPPTERRSQRITPPLEAVLETDAEEIYYRTTLAMTTSEMNRSIK
jgi:hypothetical protein